MNRFVILYGVFAIVLLTMAILGFAGCDWILMRKKDRNKYDMPAYRKHFGVVCVIGAVGYAILAAVNFNAPRWWESGPVMERGRAFGTLLPLIFVLAMLYGEKHRTVPRTEQEIKKRVIMGLIAGVLFVLVIAAMFILFSR